MCQGEYSSERKFNEVREKKGVIEFIRHPHLVAVLAFFIMSPQSRSVSMTGIAVLPRSVSEYSTVGGTVPNTFRFTKRSFSNS